MWDDNCIYFFFFQISQNQYLEGEIITKKAKEILEISFRNSRANWKKVGTAGRGCICRRKWEMKSARENRDKLVFIDFLADLSRDSTRRLMNSKSCSRSRFAWLLTLRTVENETELAVFFHGTSPSVATPVSLLLVNASRAFNNTVLINRRSTRKGHSDNRRWREVVSPVLIN